MDSSGRKPCSLARRIFRPGEKELSFKFMLSEESRNTVILPLFPSSFCSRNTGPAKIKDSTSTAKHLRVGSIHFKYPVVPLRISDRYNMVMIRTSRRLKPRALAKDQSPNQRRRKLSNSGISVLSSQIFGAKPFQSRLIPEPRREEFSKFPDQIYGAGLWIDRYSKLFHPGHQSG